MRALMECYLSDYYEEQRAQREYRTAQERLKRLQDALAAALPKLEASVSPICGSATQPHIRTFTNGRYQTITVVWDHKLQKGRICITENEVAE